MDHGLDEDVSGDVLSGLIEMVVQGCRSRDVLSYQPDAILASNLLLAISSSDSKPSNRSFIFRPQPLALSFLFLLLISSPDQALFNAFIALLFRTVSTLHLPSMLGEASFWG